MNRDLYTNLLAWKNSSRRKPLILRGARQAGKTYLLKAFGEHEYDRVHYFNFERDGGLEGFFERDLNPQRILSELSLYTKKEIRQRRDLIFFDEIQACNSALNALKYFQEEATEFHVVAAGSLLGITLSSPKSFPVGKVDFLDLYPMSFFEFLDALHEGRYRVLLENKSDLEPLSEAFHQDLIRLLRTYYFVGGMPEAVQRWLDGGDVDDVRKTQEDILDAYTLDFAKHAPAHDIPKLSMIWNSIPSHLARENKKFIFSAIHSGARARSYEDAIQWLERAGLIHRAYSVGMAKFPLKGYSDPRCFKVYALDVGLLGAMMGVPTSALLEGHALFSAHEGAFVENYVAQQLVSREIGHLHYWRSEGKVAELDFLCETDAGVLPLEVKAGINPKSKSMKSFAAQFTPPGLLRSTLLNLKQEGAMLNIPLYAIEEWQRLSRMLLETVNPD